MPFIFLQNVRSRRLFLLTGLEYEQKLERRSMANFEHQDGIFGHTMKRLDRNNLPRRVSRVINMACQKIVIRNSLKDVLVCL
jgi:hypothetical protein